MAKSRIHGVLAFKTQEGPVALWAAPTRDGGVCLIFRKLRPKTLPERFPLFGSCFPPGVPGGRPLVADVQRSGLTTVNGRTEPEPTFAWGLASKNIVRVEVHLADDSVHHNSVRRANVYEHFFAVGVLPGSSLAYAVGFDASGRKVGTYRQQRPVSPPPPPAPARTGPYRKVFDRRRTTGAITHRVVFAVAPAARGGLCTYLRFNGQPGESPSPSRSCMPRAKAPVQLLGVGGGGPPQWGFLVGRARAGVASVELRFEDRTSTRLQLTRDRFFLIFLSGRRALPGHKALALVARDRAGRVLGRRSLDRPPGS